MGNDYHLDRVEYIYCYRCGTFTQHNIYIKTKEEVIEQTVYTEYLQYKEYLGTNKYKTTKIVCNICGNTQKKTERVDNCQII